jgi:hypothetical protein
MASKTEICNMALSHVGSSKEIASLTEKSQEASACSRFYDVSLKAALRDFAWGFATKFVSVALVREQPTLEWMYAYRYPSDCVTVRRILSGSLPDTQESRIPFAEYQDTGGMLILTNQPNAVIEYTFSAEDPAKYPADFTIAFSYRLGSYIAARVTGGDPQNLGAKCFKLYQVETAIARLNSASEAQRPLDLDSEFIRVRY